MPKCTNSTTITDINECASTGGLGPCAQICVNTVGSFTCACQPGYSQNGYGCTGKDGNISAHLNVAIMCM